MKNIDKVKVVAKVFNNGGLNQLEQNGTIETAAAVGLYQGLKYKGDFKTGVKGGAAFLGVMYVIGGVKRVIVNRDYIKHNCK